MTVTNAAAQLAYRTPARVWTDALPIGNGRLGAMVYGDPVHDRWQVNDDTCWSGWPGSAAGMPASDDPSPAVVDRVRNALFDGDVVTAEREIRRVQYGHSQAYQPLAELEVVVVGSDATLRTRTLDLATAVAGWSAESPAGGTSTGEVFASAPAQAVVGRHRWERPVDVTVGVLAAHADYGHATIRAEADPSGARVVLTGRMPSDVFPHHDPGADAVPFDPAPGHAVTAVLVVELITDGKVLAVEDRLAVTGASELRVVLTTETDFVDARTELHGDVDLLLRVAGKRAAAVGTRDHDELLAEHVAEHRSWFDRFELDLGDGRPAETDVDVLLERSAAGDVAPQLTALAVSYGRYLMIASSRPGTRAINLQGVWNPWVQPPWSSNYTVNINTEMNTGPRPPPT